MNDIFISYKVHNRAKAIEYYRVLKAQGYSVWFDQFVPIGANWKSTIFEQISNSKLILCLLSESCLIDDWVKSQLESATFLRKQIIYITLDETNWQENLEYSLDKRVYESLDCAITSDPFFGKVDIEPTKQERNYYVMPLEGEKINIHKLLNPIINFGILCISIILTFLFGIHFFRISLDYRYSYVLLGISVLLGLSYIKKWYVYLIQCLGAISIFLVTIYMLPPYYISGISVNGLVFSLFFVFSTYLRYSTSKLWLAIPMALFLAGLYTALDAGLLIFFNTVLDLNLYWISLFLLCIFLFSIGWGNRNEFKNFKK